MSEPVLAVDIGGTKVAVALVSDGRVLAQETAPTPAAAGPEAVLETVVACSGRLAPHAPLPSLVGVACAGIVSEGRVRAMSPDLLPGWHDYPLEERLATRLHVITPAPPRVVALNDAQAAAYGEHAHGAGRGRDSLLFVTVSTGVGGGLVLGGRLWRGAAGLAGHVGHMGHMGHMVNMGGGRVEGLASGTALARRAAELGRQADARAVIESADSGEAWASALLNEATVALAGALADARVLLDPEVVVLGGGVGLNPSFRASLERELDRLPETVRPRLVPAELGAAAGLVGAATWALTRTKP